MYSFIYIYEKNKLKEEQQQQNKELGEIGVSCFNIAIEYSNFLVTYKTTFMNIASLFNFN